METVRLRCCPILLLIGVQWTSKHSRCNFLLLTISLSPPPFSPPPHTLIRISRFLFSRCRILFHEYLPSFSTPSFASSSLSFSSSPSSSSSSPPPPPLQPLFFPSMKSVRVQSRCTFKRSVRRGGTRGEMKRRRKGAERELPIAPRCERKSSGWEEEQKQIYDYPTVLSTRETLRCFFSSNWYPYLLQRNRNRENECLSLSLSLFRHDARWTSINVIRLDIYSRGVVSSYEIYIREASFRVMRPNFSRFPQYLYVGTYKYAYIYKARR